MRYPSRTVTRILVVGIAFWVLAACGGRGVPDDATLVLPGTFSQQTTIADFEQLFGKENVKVGEVPNGYGDPPRGVILFPDDPSRRAYVAFHDSKELTDVASIVIRDPGSRWRGKHGVHIGMSMAELRKLNGKPFNFSGFDEERRALAHDQWSPAMSDGDAALGAFDVGEGEHMYFEVNLALRAGDVPAEAYPHDEGSASSDDPSYPKLGEIVEVTGFGATTSLDDEWS
jgi:hypothetical protein